MAADLHIHIFDAPGLELTVEDLKGFFCNTLGSKYCSIGYRSWEQRELISDKIEKTPDVWIGEVSWLKAGMSDTEEESNSFIPPTVNRVYNLIGQDLPLLTEELIEKVVMAFDRPNMTGYMLSDSGKVKTFLEEHKGRRVFTVSW